MQVHDFIDMLADFWLLFSVELFHKHNSFYIIVGTLFSGVALAQDNKALFLSDAWEY
jgi:hypothetical protein